MTEESQSENNLYALTLLRDRLLPELLQDDESNVLYWAGKELARTISLTGITALETFFMDASFGLLTLISQADMTLQWRLEGPVVMSRLQDNESASFALEAGFLAEQVQQQLGIGAEAQWEVRNQTIDITVMTDLPGTLAE